MATNTTYSTRGDVTALTRDAVNIGAAIGKGLTKGIDKLLESLGASTVKEFCNCTDINYPIMQQIMQLNVQEYWTNRKISLSDAASNGDSRRVSGLAMHPEYAKGMDYVLNVVDKIEQTEASGQASGRRVLKADNNGKYYTNHNQIGGYWAQDLHYDDNEVGVPNAVVCQNPNQDGFVAQNVIAQTRKLFQDRKMATIISRFHTEQAPEYLGDAKTAYGLSHGRNLLKKQAENNDASANTYYINGYNNPYCRVWTHHYQYDKLMKTIRPFVQLAKDGEHVSYQPTLSEFHQWPQFEVKGSNENWGWKSLSNDGWEKSVLNNKTGLLNIAPSYQHGGNTNVHTKQCMFSIENLAWKGYDPYSFEKALSWEQRGPNGGRIMWFPPYGISFQENHTANWSQNTFIGRGEDVYTYVNSSRKGTLNFMLVVDHPSIIDYVGWNEGNEEKVSDTDILRFFAGCDAGIGNKEALVKEARDKFFEITQNETPRLFGGRSTEAEQAWNEYKALLMSDNQNGNFSLIDYATPTPLTDEYDSATEEIREKVKVITQPEPEVESAPSMRVQFAVFFPNNYSGYYDSPVSNRGYHELNAVAYLLAGRGTQMIYDETDINKCQTMPISFLGISTEQDKSELFPNGCTGSGYEMNEGTGMNGSNDDFASQNDEKNYIVGCAKSWADSARNTRWIPDYNKKWYYRIDGHYTLDNRLPKNEYDTNCFDQYLLRPDNYRDTKSFGLNSNADKVKEFNDLFENSEIETLTVSFAEMAAVLAISEDDRNFILRKAVAGDHTKNMSKLDELFNGNYSVKTISVKGYSNSHGNNASAKVNKSRNEGLAQHRAETIKQWLDEFIKEKIGENNVKDTKSEAGIITFPSTQVSDEDKSNVSSITAKKYRSAIVVLEFATTETKNATDIQPEENNNENTPSHQIIYQGFHQELDSNGKPTGFFIKDGEGDGRRWEFDKNTSEMVLYHPGRGRWDNLKFSHASNSGIDAKMGKGEYNKVRYDQEYHFFKVLEAKDPVIFDKLMDKIKYFDPAFHSMTPEGFNARLTFLNQCMRQGDSVTISDANDETQEITQTTNNLAFGRAPYCVLRLGDFYNQMIVIDNISITYDPLVWDLNTEGIGVQPLIANVSISFTFIGGGDLAGPVRRLQNAMSFNYYSNARLYDNRADRMDYKWDPKTCGALEKNQELNEEKSYFHHVRMHKPN